MKFRIHGKFLRRASLAALVSIAGSTGAATAQDAQPQAASPVTETHEFGSWAVRCYRAAGAACDLSQSVVLKSRNLRELGISIVYIPNRNQYGGQFVVPLGVSFAKGMTIVVGSYRLQNLRYHRCERIGCFVEGILPQALIDSMSEDENAKAAVQIEAVDGRKFAFPFTLNGFGEGVALLKQLDTKRSITVPAPAKH
jgi:invasion protein IalB